MFGCSTVSRTCGENMLDPIFELPVDPADGFGIRQRTQSHLFHGKMIQALIFSFFRASHTEPLAILYMLRLELGNGRA